MSNRSKLLKEAKSPRERAMHLIMAASEKDIEQIEMYLKAVVISKTKKLQNIVEPAAPEAAG